MENPNRLSRLRNIIAVLAIMLFIKVFAFLLIEYRWYFPADFDSSAFLSGRQQTFVGFYRVAFYAHITSGPIGLLLGTMLLFSGGKGRFATLHRFAGRIHIFVVVAILAPSGCIMASQAFAGPTAGLGFAALSLGTAASAIIAVRFARTGRIQIHQRWATRCYIFLLSPLILRIAAGVAHAVQMESDLFYQLNAWLSWAVPLIMYEAWTQRKLTNRSAARFLKRWGDTGKAIS